MVHQLVQHMSEVLSVVLSEVSGVSACVAAVQYDHMHCCC